MDGSNCNGKFKKLIKGDYSNDLHASLQNIVNTSLQTPEGGVAIYDKMTLIRQLVDIFFAKIAHRNDVRWGHCFLRRILPDLRNPYR
jgi:hypothetical protein